MIITIIVAHFLSLSLLFATTWAAAYQAPLSSTISQIFFEFISNRSVTLSNNPILCHPLLLLPSIFSSIRVFSNYLVLSIKQPKYWSFSFSIHPSNEYSGLTFLRIDWFDLAVQGTLKSLLQYHNSKASVLLHSAFFVVQLSYSYITIGKTIALTRRTLVGKVKSLLFNVLSRSTIPQRLIISQLAP